MKEVQQPNNKVAIPLLLVLAPQMLLNICQGSVNTDCCYLTLDESSLNCLQMLIQAMFIFK